MTIASEITDLQTNLAAAKAAVTTKGGTVGNTGLAGLATEIASIPSGGGGGGNSIPDYHGYGYVLYKSANDDGLSPSRYDFQSASDLDLFCDGSMEVYGLGDDDAEYIMAIVLGDEITALPNNFCSNFLYLYICVLPSTLTSIGNNVFTKCYRLGYLALPEGLLSIGNNFFSDNRDVEYFELPSTLTSIGTGLLYKSKLLVNVNIGSLPASVIAASADTFATPTVSHDSYTTGITITGTYAADWLTKFPNSSSSPYRNLINGDNR